MTRLLALCSGAEERNNEFWDSILSGTITASTEQYAGGAYSYKFSQNSQAVKNFTAKAEIYDRKRFYFAEIALPAGNTDLVEYRNGSAETLAKVRLNPDTKLLELYVGAVKVTSTSLPISAGRWYLLEMHLKVDNSSGVFDLKIDSILSATFSGDTQPSVYTTVDNYKVTSPNSSGAMYLDDLAMNDTAGGVDDSWCGDGYFERLKADGNGDVSDWMGSDGNQVDNYLLVDDCPHDSDTTYIEDDTAGHRDMETIEDYVGTDKTVLRAWVAAEARSTLPTGEQIKLGVKVNGSVYLGSAIDLINTYQLKQGSNLAVNPDTGVGWLEADLDATQVVVETV